MLFRSQKRIKNSVENNPYLQLLAEHPYYIELRQQKIIDETWLVVSYHRLNQNAKAVVDQLASLAILYKSNVVKELIRLDLINNQWLVDELLINPLKEIVDKLHLLKSLYETKGFKFLKEETVVNNSWLLSLLQTQPSLDRAIEFDRLEDLITLYCLNDFKQLKRENIVNNEWLVIFHSLHHNVKLAKTKLSQLLQLYHSSDCQFLLNNHVIDKAWLSFQIGLSNANTIQKKLSDLKSLYEKPNSVFNYAKTIGLIDDAWLCENSKSNDIKTLAQGIKQIIVLTNERNRLLELLKVKREMEKVLDSYTYGNGFTTFETTASNRKDVSTDDLGVANSEGISTNDLEISNSEDISTNDLEISNNQDVSTNDLETSKNENVSANDLRSSLGRLSKYN